MIMPAQRMIAWEIFDLVILRLYINLPFNK